MKAKETKSGKLRVTMSMYEASVLRSILSYTRLGVSVESDAVFKFLELTDQFPLDEVKVKFEYTEDEWMVINV